MISTMRRLENLGRRNLFYKKNKGIFRKFLAGIILSGRKWKLINLNNRRLNIYSEISIKILFRRKREGKRMKGKDLSSKRLR
jgi:hypothetical protein